MARVLVIDDEPTLLATVKFNLEREGYGVSTATAGEAGIKAARQDSPDLVILDLMLPGMHGFEVCRVLRRETSVPIILLTARDDEIDKIVGLELGADDYITKPFSMKELIARVRARLRRVNEDSGNNSQPLVAGALKLDLARREATKSGRTLHLKPKEFELLAFLMRNRGRVVSRNQLLQAVWRYDGFDQTRTVDVHVGRLRGKIEGGPDSAMIITVRGAGYRFEG